jgi:hypothetical protein
LYLPPPMFGPPGGAEPEPPKIELGFCQLDRKAEEERWLVESLLAMEPDLKDEEFADQAMVFCVFGRGRALPPFIGKGINRDNLLNCVDFITGACSCMVKDQNPGMDLLFTKDWWAVAEKLANEFGAEEGNEAQYAAADMFPDLVIPGDAEPAEESVAEEGAAEDGAASPEASGDAESNDEAGDLVAQASSPVDAVSGEAEGGGESAEDVSADVSVRDRQDSGDTTAADESSESESREVALAKSHPGHDGGKHPAAADGGQDRRSGFAGVFAVGTGLFVALVLLLGATFVVLRPK